MADPTSLTIDELHDLLALCLSGDSRHKPSVSREFFREGLTVALEDPTPPAQFVRQIHAAGLLTFGDLSMVEVILDNIPEHVVAGSATGYCVAASSTVLSAMLPLPSNLRTEGRTVVERTGFRKWFAEHRNSLIFDPELQRFHEVMDG